ncbi:hypothetical protein [Alicyclobacillus tolerans]|uniref:Uncharacterized protein n=1 Tax=Alicyclobacillus tolerans TaxID=90970 RepID=A0A1M6TRF7_9BACL|nr:hypothetical protein [Alicyclobacillus montanus]SHK59483.1 hypothetical protein SAMN05443507_11752 [Alicyclobacillus montanus]
MDDEIKEFLAEVEDHIRYDIHEVSNQLKDMQIEVNILKQQVSNLEKIIRIVDEHVAGGLSGIRIDVALMKDELEKQGGH